jgi:hypothetical protein
MRDYDNEQRRFIIGTIHALWMSLALWAILILVLWAIHR